MLDKLLDLVNPLCFKHVLRYRPDGAHEPRHVLYQNIIAGDHQFLFFSLPNGRGAAPTLIEGGQQRLLTFIIE